MPNKKLSVGLVFDSSLDSSDGVAQYVKTIGAWLSKQGHQVSYIVGETKAEAYEGGRIYSMTKNINVSFNGNKISTPLPASRKSITELLGSQKFDVLHVQLPHSPFMASKAVKLGHSRAAVVGTFHILPYGSVARLGSRILGLFLKKNLRLFDEIVSVSQPAAAFAKTYYGIDSKVIPNTVNVDFYKLARAKEHKEQNIVFVGRLVERKGCRYLIDAFAKMKNKKALLHIVSDGPERSNLEALVRKLKIEDRVIFYGFVSEKKKAELLARADIACFPSTSGESFGIVLIEAMAAGAKVVLGGDNPGYASVLGEQPQLLVNVCDSQEFTARLDSLLKGGPKITALSDWQASQASKYDVETVGRQIENLYRQTIANKHKHQA